MLLDPTTLIGNEIFQSNFIRIGNDVYITDPDDLSTTHKELAIKHAILERVEFLKSNNPTEVDGGMLFMNGTILRLGAEAVTLDVPLTKQSRTTTVEKLKKRIPKYSIREVAE